MLKDKCIVIGVTGSIASYKIAYLVRLLKKQNADVHIIMTKNATKFISPLTFETLSNNKCIVETFATDFEHNIEHISLAKKADLILIAPASANVISKVANGMADDILTTTVLAANCKKIIAPTMNTNMYTNEITQYNLKKLKDFKFKVIEAETGSLACKDVGIGKMPEPETLYEHILKEISTDKSLEGKKILISAGATCEYIDPVRYITNPSTGKMGFALAKASILKGAEVTLVCAKTSAKPPMFANVINVTTAEEMLKVFKEIYKDFDIIFKTSAVSDFTPKTVSSEKIKKNNDETNIIELKRTSDILKYLGENKLKNQILCGFSMETSNLIENSKLKLINKNLDLIVANNLKVEGSGFGTDTNIVSIIDKFQNVIELEKLSKFQVSNKILEYITNNFIL